MKLNNVTLKSIKSSKKNW